MIAPVRSVLAAVDCAEADAIRPSVVNSREFVRGELEGQPVIQATYTDLDGFVVLVDMRQPGAERGCTHMVAVEQPLAAA